MQRGPRSFLGLKATDSDLITTKVFLCHNARHCFTPILLLDLWAAVKMLSGIYTLENAGQFFVAEKQKWKTTQDRISARTKLVVEKPAFISYGLLPGGFQTQVSSKVFHGSVLFICFVSFCFVLFCFD